MLKEATDGLWKFLQGVTDSLVKKPILSIPLVIIIIAFLVFLWASGFGPKHIPGLPDVNIYK